MVDGDEVAVKVLLKELQDNRQLLPKTVQGCVWDGHRSLWTMDQDDQGHPH